MNDLSHRGYEELRRRAAFLLARYGRFVDAPHGPTSLVHRAALRLGGSDADDHDRWTIAMRRILIDLYRRQRRSPEATRARPEIADRSETLRRVLHELDGAVRELSRTHPLVGVLVELRYYEGRSWERISQETGLSRHELRERVWPFVTSRLRHALRERVVDAPD